MFRCKMFGSKAVRMTDLKALLQTLAPLLISEAASSLAQFYILQMV